MRTALQELGTALERIKEAGEKVTYARDARWRQAALNVLEGWLGIAQAALEEARKELAAREAGGGDE